MYLLATLYLVLFIVATLAFIVTLCFYQKAKIDLENENEEHQKYKNLYINLHNQFYEDVIEWNGGHYKVGCKLREKSLDIKC